MPRRPPSPLEQLFDILSDAAQTFADRMADNIARAMNIEPKRKIPTGERGRNPRRQAQRTERQPKTHYQVLGVSRHSTQSEIRAAYLALAKKYHPDAKGNSKRMIEVNQAYEVLKDVEKRRAYDFKLATTR